MKVFLKKSPIYKGNFLFHLHNNTHYKWYNTQQYTLTQSDPSPSSDPESPKIYAPSDILKIFFIVPPKKRCGTNESLSSLQSRDVGQIPYTEVEFTPPKTHPFSTSVHSSRLIIKLRHGHAPHIEKYPTPRGFSGIH